MGWFDKLKSLFIKQKASSNANFLTLDSGFSSVSYETAFNATYCNCVSALARHLSKIEVGIFNDKSQGLAFRYLEKILKFRPNPVQTANSFWYSMAYDFFFSGVAVAYIEWNGYKVSNLWAISSKEVQDVRIKGHDIFIRFNLNGEVREDVLENFIALIRHPSTSNPFNTYDPSMNKILEILATNEEGIIKAIQNSSLIRFIVASSANMSEQQVIKKQEQFKDRINKADSILYVTNAENLTQVNNQSKWATSDDIKEMKREVYNFFGVNEKFLDSSYDENSWQSVYDGALEPFITALSQELTLKLFSDREFDVGNRIEVLTSPLQTASLQTRIKLAEAYLKLPTIRPNVVCDLLYLPRLENGDKEVQSLNYVASNKVEAYQGVEGEDKDKPPKEDDKDKDKRDEDNGKQQDESESKE